jgi:hypothetical protein
MLVLPPPTKPFTTAASGPGFRAVDKREWQALLRAVRIHNHPTVRSYERIDHHCRALAGTYSVSQSFRTWNPTRR